ncbi:hypothetical protein KIH86_26295 [Paenibacillus sp. HN-1]|uniref:hypothetical protein n=1 Tax=Paenibacillus TaxID=44249 RepID=UPI001CA95216|nr:MULTISPECIES: hypothetical protein [Paenibacillus]MBY9081581.1 hypothetical protein [Paenibacillus sp. CGMCC 1.18879]MBY9087704.1 hypothetical protein [Paenibacillus sinensis]
MQFIGQEVTHIVFGKGTISKVEEGRVEVDFPNAAGHKMFVYPDAFEKFISMTDGRSQEKVLVEVEQTKKDRQAEKARIEQKFQEERLAAEEAAKKKSVTSRKASVKTKRK